ncbi:HC-toxin synthetase [Penicillium angulare]|uniref:HC-toxin synthetase n=1 Tax=Penicillium angulare TaxID=116970 RepID=A0A9W9G6M0_9EURO|nr:HC-toxin synthetase [Penicillium angulare]
MKDIVAEIITPAGSERILAAFVWMENEGKSSHQDQRTLRQEPFAVASAQFQSKELEVQAILHDSIPSYMVPSLFIPLHYMPMRVSGKVDKTQLCAHAARFSRIELEAFMGVRPNRRGPSTWAEEMIGGLIQDLLKMVDFPGMDDNFFRLGGDSVIAMKLVRRAFDMGITVNVSDIFNFPKLCDLALLSEKRCNGVRPSFDLMATKSPLLLSSSSSGMQISVITDPPAFSMISTKQKAEYFDQILAHSVISLEDVVDMYPCTPLQEGLMSLSVVSPGTYIRRDIFELSSNLDKDLMKNAWSRVISANPILRTRIFQPTSGNQTLQVVLKTSLTWHDYDVNDMTQYLTDSDCKSSMGFMDPLITLAIINARAGKHEANSKRFLSVTLHHAIYDSLSIHLIFDQVEAAYRNYQLRYRPFAPFIEYIERCQRVGGLFWSKQFEGAGEHTTIFPALPVEHYIPRPVDILGHSVECLPTSLGYTPNIHLRAAWAMTMFQYSSSQDVVFGVTVTGRNCEFPGIDQISGPTFATLPLRAIFDPSQTIGEILSSFQRQFTETIPYEQYGLRKILQPPPHKYEDASHQRQLFTSPLNVAQHRGRSQWDTYAITVECLPQLNGGIDIRAIFDALLISPSTVDRILRTFSHFLLEMSHDISRPIGEIDMISVKDRCQIATWNSSLLKSHDQDISSAMEMCVQSLIRRQCLAAPNSIAVCAWDGDLTYGQLEKQAAILASHLQGMRIGPGSIVPLCFEKSRWTTVAMFGVMKAGAAFVLLDPFSQPLHRMEEICRQVGCKVIISSPANVEIIRAIPSCQIVILEHLIQRPDIASAEFLLPSISPDSALYAVFTSGSTGHPKGIIIEHGGYATSALARQNMFGLHRGSRVLQFASYAFDVSIENNLDTLIAGGCVCVPSETQRTWEFTQIANEYQVTYVDLTPSTSRLLCPSNTPTIETMVLGGEAITKEDVKRWANHVRLLNAYGPAECSVTATIQEIGSDSAVDNTESTSIGQSFPTAATWIVDPSDYTRLLPIGAVGELVIEGPLVGRGYLDASYNPRRFNPFIQETTKWRASFEQLLGSMSSRMYKTGDLVQYNETGSLRYLGRKDQQVKINGQRIELGEIEAKLRIVFSHSTDAICDVIEKRETSQSLLVAFLTDCNDKEVMTSSKDSVIIFSDHQFRSQIGKAQVKLREFLPRYMVPTVFIPVRRIPHTAAGKADRRLLREAASALSHQQLTQFTATREARVPFTVTEKKIQTLWAKVLNFPTDTIDANDGFFHIGGNSILAMKLAALARFDKVKLSMPDLFENSSLESLASALDASAQAPEDASDLYFDWDAEVAIPSTFPVNGYPPRSDSLSDSGVEIILTGCTGHLGGQILRQLICSNYIGHIHCVAVRNPDKVFDGFSENAGGCRTLIRSKVTVYKGDLSLPRIGLSEAAEAKLLANCRAIIHCGALVSFVRSYELLRDVNVGSTKYLASLAVRASMGFHFISTVGVNNIPGYEKGIVEEGSAASTPPPRDGAGGYISSKWVCEVFLELIHQRYGIPLFIHRPSNIVGDGASKDDIINAFLDTSCRIGIVPVLSGWTGYFDLIGIETAARNIVGAMQGTVQSQSQQNSTLEIQYRHETGDAVIPIAGLEKFLEKISGKPVDLVSFEDWVSTARQEQKTSKLMLEYLELRKDKGISMPLIRNSRIAWFANGLSPVSRFGTRAGWNAEKDI